MSARLRALPLGARLVLALLLALLLQAVVSALVLHQLFFSDPRQAELRRQLFQALMQLHGIAPSPWRRLLLSPLTTTLLSAALVAAITVPLMRSLTARLRRLQRGVQQLGQLDLRARVAVEGGDEVGQLACAFNQAAARIETLVTSHKSLLAYTSHELRTPLTRLRLALEGLREPGPHSARHWQEAQRNLAELDSLIGTILLYSRLDAGAQRTLQPQPVDLLALAAEEAAAEGAEVQGDWVRMRADEKLLRHAIRNLLGNARKHAPGSSIEVDVQAMPGGARVRVRDHGPGVRAADAERVFQPFERLRGDGSGLGLALVRRIADLHGGRAYLENPGGAGATFVLEVAELPAPQALP